MTFVLDLPRLETERLVLRGWRESDFDCIAEILADETQSRYIGGQKSRSQAWRSFAGLLGHHALRGYTFFAIEQKTNGKTVGWAGPWNPEGWPEPEIGYALHASAAGKGLATEAAARTLRFVYEMLGWKTAISLIDKKNTASQNVGRKLGAVVEGSTLLFDSDPADIWRHLSPHQFLEQHA